MFGVSGVFFHGIGLRHIGIPSMTRAWPPPGPKMITSYFASQVRRVFATSCVLDVVVRDLVEVERLAPPAFGLRARATCA